MKQQETCIFCKIARGEAPVIKVFEDARTFVFMDINPANEGHTLVISKAHFDNLLDVEEVDLNAVGLTTQRVARAIYRSLEPDGVRISQFNGAAAGQTVFHYHVHLVPMRAGQRVSRHGREPGNLEQIEAVAAKIRGALDE
jgi:histidine triad (HIT) family protein